MKIIEEVDSKFWNRMVATNSSPSSFLQSWEWGEFQQKLGNKIYRLATENQEILAQVIVKNLPLGRTYLEIPKGPIFDLKKKDELDEAWILLVEKLKELGEKEHAVLLRLNPPYEVHPEIFPKLGFTFPQLLLRQKEPEQTLLVDLSKSQEELLQNMHEKSRYNVRLAERSKVLIRDATSDEQAFVQFLDLLEETNKRAGIVTWPKARFWKFREVFLRPNLSPESPTAILLAGELSGRILAGAIIAFFGDTATYLYAASSSENRLANAPSLVLWEAIQRVKTLGYQWYDMWGIAPRNQPEHPWAGITRFKSRYVKIGVTGREIHYPGSRDLALDSKFYLLFRLGQKLRRLVRFV